MWIRFWTALVGQQSTAKLISPLLYHQVEVHPDHTHRTAFQSHWGLYEYTVLPLRLMNAPATFQRLMDMVLREELDKFVTVHLDDIS